ncbi:MAG: MFS transporter, partial [Burkholderiales bacterium]
MKNWLILMLLISFGSIGAVCYTPGFPELAAFFGVNNSNAQLTVTLYLVGYAIGQLFYGPLAHSLGSNKTIIIGAMIEIMGAFLCAISGPLHSFNLLIGARVIMALGAASGLKMTFTLAANLYSKEATARVMGLLTLAFAVTPGIGVLIGGILVNHFGWTSTFYLMVVYGLAIILLSFRLPELYTK